MVILAACSASSRVIKTYEGVSPEESQVARLQTPASIKLLSIDGERQTIYLAKNIGLNYELLPGDHTIVYQYASIWAVPRGVDREDFAENTAKVQNVDSAPITSVVTLKPGERYIMRHQEVSDLSAALGLARRFSAEIVSIDSGEIIAQRNRAQDEQSSGQLAKRDIQTPGVVAGAGQPKAPLAAAPSSASTAAAVITSPHVESASADNSAQSTASTASTIAAEVSRLDALKVLWEKSSKEDKKAFLRWAFE